jgi:hypothetical protein
MVVEALKLTPHQALAWLRGHAHRHSSTIDALADSLTAEHQDTAALNARRRRSAVTGPS